MMARGMCVSFLYLNVKCKRFSPGKKDFSGKGLSKILCGIVARKMFLY
jgi:hypothetical protein